MKAEFWAQVENAYLEAAELPGEQRTPFLEKVYRDRPDVRREVESLLEHKEAAEHLTQSSIVVSAARLFDDDDDLIGTIVGGKYRVRECIGSGGQADVYLADHIALDSSFALKRAAPVLRNDPEFRQRFLEEARRAVVLRHDNVARVHDVLESGGEMFVVMEHIEGETLRQRLERLRRPLTVEEFLPIAIQCAAALAAAHEKRIVHLDVKPENIMLTTDERVKICDFGIARRLSAKSNNDTDARTPDWKFAGTPAYMAPEVILSYQFDERADLFSLGTVFYEMLTGRNLFLASTGPATTARVVSEQAAPMNNPAVGRKLETIVMRLLEKDPANRLANAGELLKALEVIQRSRNRFVGFLGDTQETFRRSAFTIAAATILCVVALSPFVWHYRQGVRDWIFGPPLPDKRIVVILPFHVIGDTRDAGAGFYSEGVSVVLTDRLKLLTLNAMPDLQVVTPDEITARRVDSAEKARGEFGATIILSGTLLFSEENVHLSYQLIRGSDLVELRRSSQTVQVGDPFALQDLVTRDLLTMLEIELTPPASQPLQVFGTRHPRAFFLYTEGKGALRNNFEPKNIDVAIELFTQALEVDPQYASGYAAIGQAYWLKFQHFNQPTWIDQALKACEKALTLDERSSEAHSCIGIVREAQGYYDLAIDEFNQAIKYSGMNSNAHQGLGRVLEALGQYDQAEKAYLRAIELSPQYWANQMWIASFYNRQHDYSKAIDHYLQALAISPENGQVYYSLGGTYANNGQYDQAIPVLKRAIELRSYLPEPYSNLGLTYIRLHQYQDAIPLLEKAVTLGKDHRVTGNLARIYWLTNQPEKANPTYELAIRQAEELLQLNPKDHGAHLLVGRYYAMLHRQTEAVSHLTIALNLHRGDPHYLMIAAVAYLQMGDRVSALGMLEQAATTHGFTSAQIIEEPELDVLKNEPRYVALTSNSKKRQ